MRIQRAKNVYEGFYEKFMLLEIKIPREVSKSPQAMEFILDAIYQVAGHPSAPEKKKFSDRQYREDYRKYLDDKYLQGQVRLWMTLEIESRGGEIHFYIGTQKKYKDIISSYIFSQYPGIEVTEAEDYTDKIRPVLAGGQHHPWTAFIELAGDKKSFLPLKTYVDYGLDKDPKDEFKIDPMIPLLESMANIKEDEHLWYQILIRASMNDKEVKADAQKRIDEMMGIKRFTEEDEKLDKKNKKGTIKEQTKKLPDLLPKEKDEIELINRYIGKLLFDTKIQVIYIAPKGKTRPEADQIVRNAFKSFNNQNFNQLKVTNQNSTHGFLDYPDKRREERAKAAFFFIYTTRNPLINATGGPVFIKDLYARYRDYGWWSFAKMYREDFKGYWFKYDEEELKMPIYFVSNSEELATLYHFPSKAFSAPKFGRIESVKSEAPTNLPI